MKKIIIVNLLVVIVLIAFMYIFMLNEHQKDKAKSLFTFYTVERQCFNTYKNYFRDPESSYLLEINKNQPITGKGREILVFYAMVKNGFGVYGKQAMECVIRGGKYQEEETKTRLIINSVK